LPHSDSLEEITTSKPEIQPNRMNETPNVDLQPLNVDLSKGNGMHNDVSLSVLL